jgi:oligopeptide transport system substrate-binding protein
MMSIDSSEITINALNDAGYVATGILSNGMPGFKPDQMKFKFDPAAGKKLLAEAGFPDPSKMPELVITQIGSGPDASGPAQSIQNTLKNGLGLPVRIEVVDQQRAISQLREGKVAAWSDMPILTYTDPYAMLARFSSKSPSNYFGYNNPEIDSLLLKATATQDAKARYAIYQDIEAKLLDDGAIMPIMWAKFYYLQRPWVSGYKTNALGIMPYTEVEVK